MIRARVILEGSDRGKHYWPDSFEALPAVGHQIKCGTATAVVKNVVHTGGGIELHCELAKNELLG